MKRRKSLVWLSLAQVSSYLGYKARLGPVEGRERVCDDILQSLFRILCANSIEILARAALKGAQDQNS